MVLRYTLALLAACLLAGRATAAEPFRYQVTDTPIAQVLEAVSSHFGEKATMWYGEDGEKKVSVDLNAKSFLEAVAQISIQTGLGFDGSNQTVNFQSDKDPATTYAMAGDTVVVFTGPAPAKDLRDGIGTSDDTTIAFSLAVLRWYEDSAGSQFGDITFTDDAGATPVQPSNTFISTGLKNVRIYPLPEALQGRTATLSGELSVSSYLDPVKLELPLQAGAKAAAEKLSASVNSVDPNAVKIHIDYPSGATPEQDAFITQVMTDLKAGKMPDKAMMAKIKEVQSQLSVYSVTEAYLILADGTKKTFQGSQSSSSPQEGIDATYFPPSGIDLTGATLHLEVSPQATATHPFSMPNLSLSPQPATGS